MIGSWKSTLAGIFTAFFAFVLFSPELFSQPQWLVPLAKFAVVGGLAGLGIVAKDYNATGGGSH